MWKLARTVLALLVLVSSSIAGAHPDRSGGHSTTYRGTILAIHDESEAPAYVIDGFVDVQLQLPDGRTENSVFETLLFPCPVEVGDTFILEVNPTEGTSQIICQPSKS